MVHLYFIFYFLKFFLLACTWVILKLNPSFGPLTFNVHEYDENSHYKHFYINYMVNHDFVS